MNHRYYGPFKHNIVKGTWSTCALCMLVFTEAIMFIKINKIHTPTGEVLYYTACKWEIGGRKLAKHEKLGYQSIWKEMLEYSQYMTVISCRQDGYIVTESFEYFDFLNK